MHLLAWLYTTCSTKEQSKHLSRMALENKLAGCVNCFPIESIYWWENQIHENEEIALLFKTRSQCLTLLYDFILINHPYQLPVILMGEAETSPIFFNHLYTISL
jgi:periplasmic divalent cation tolerance protein